MINFSLQHVEFTSETWKAPDGKIVPFDRADITELLIGRNPDRHHDASELCVEVSRWPRKVTIHLIVAEGVDGYTDGGDGFIFEVMSVRKYILAVTDRVSFTHNFEQVMQAAYEKYRELDRKELWI